MHKKGVFMHKVHANSIEMSHMIMRITISIIFFILWNLYILRKWHHVETSIKWGAHMVSTKEVLVSLLPFSFWQVDFTNPTFLSLGSHLQLALFYGWFFGHHNHERVSIPKKSYIGNINLFLCSKALSIIFFRTSSCWNFTRSSLVASLSTSLSWYDCEG